MNIENDDLVVINRDGVEVHPRSLLFDAITQCGTSELLILRGVRQVDSLDAGEHQNLSDEHTLYQEKLAVMGEWLHIILYRTTKDRKIDGRYTAARFALLDSQLLHYQKLNIDQLVDWLIARAPNNEALVAAVSDIGDAIKRQQEAARHQS